MLPDLHDHRGPDRLLQPRSHKAKKIQINAKDEVSIVSGKASILLKKNGDITIQGKKITVKGSGDVVIKGKKIAQN